MTVSTLLSQLTIRYQQNYQQRWQTLPRKSHIDEQSMSPCVVQQDAEYAYWQAYPLPTMQSLLGVERALDMLLRPEIHVYFGYQYAGNIPVIDQQQRKLLLLQPFDATDFMYLQENMIGHLLMQRQLKLSPSCFLATTEDDQQIISLCNLTGCVWLERVSGRRGHTRRDTLAVSLEQWLSQLTINCFVK